MKFSSHGVLLPWLLIPLLPALIAVSAPPDVSLYSRLMAVFVWGVALLWSGRTRCQHIRAAVVGGGLATFVLLSGFFVFGRQASLVMLGGSAVLAGWWLAFQPQLRNRVLYGLFAGYALAALGALGICLVQFFVPHWADGFWIAVPTTAGRAAGNLRQPNLQATMFIWGAVAVAWLAQQHGRLRLVFHLLLFGVVVGLALTGSRTGMVLTGLLLLWGWFDRGLPPSVRVGLIVAPLLLWGVAEALEWWARSTGGQYFAEARARSGSDISSSRFAIWSNTLQLIVMYPWSGVGWGNFNFAWTLTAFPQRPVAFFDHTHNLPLQLAVELGIPAALLICFVFLWLSWRAKRALWHSETRAAVAARAAFMMLLAVLFHSLLEYPLWYPYFLLPAAFLWGLCLGLGLSAARPEPRGEGQSVLAGAITAVGVLMICGAAWAFWDYQRITQIFAPRGVEGARPLKVRISEGQRSMLFGVHADYAAVTTARRPSDVFEAFERPLHRLIDARLMLAYAQALEERGEADKALYVVQRLREFRHPLGSEFFAVCERPRPVATVPPFQCETTPIQLTFRDFQSVGR